MSASRRGPAVLLALLLLAAFVVRIAFLNGRWVNPDEGAHLMDALLVLDGFIPEVDFGSRQVFYTYVLAFLLRVVGVSYEAARMYPVLATVGVGFLVYLIAGRLFDRRVALLAAAIYLFLPFTIVFGTQVKTEPLTILLSCLGVYAVLVALERKQSLPLFLLAGVCFGLAYYVRQSSLAFLLAIVVILGVLLRQMLPTLRASAAVFAGFGMVCVAVIGIYSTMLPVSQVLATGALNPVMFVVRSVEPVWSLVAYSSPEPAGATVPASIVPTLSERVGSTESSPPSFDDLERADQPWATTVRNIIRTANLNSFLIAGMLLSPFFLLAGTRAPFERRRSHDLRAAAVLYAWLGAVGAAYAFYAVVRGFFPAYFGELIPPLAILTAVVALDGLGRLRGHAARLVDLAIFAALLVAVVAILTVVGPLGVNRPLYFIAVPPVLAFVYLRGGVRSRHLLALGVLALSAVGVVLLDGVVRGLAPSLLYLVVLLSLALAAVFAGWRLDPRKELGRARAFAGYSLLMSTCMLWLGPTMAQINRQYGGMWSPETVSEVAAYVAQNTEEGDEVISGAVIWEFEARRHPLLLISHPLGHRASMANEVQQAARERLRVRPPPVIVLDGYTEQIYGAQLAGFNEVLNTRYRLDRVVGGSQYPVRLYRLRQTTESIP